VGDHQLGWQADPPRQLNGMLNALALNDAGGLEVDRVNQVC